MKRILELLGFVCSHDFTWPQRRKDGKDWQSCNHCGAERVSVVQFGKLPHTNGN